VALARLTSPRDVTDKSEPHPPPRRAPDQHLRADVDSALRDLLPADVVEVTGRPEQRVQQVVAAMAT
jgi:hypothetical protein